MEENLRDSGIDIIGDVPWGTHFCQLYQTKGDLMEILLPYFKAGLENNEFCIWVTSEPLDVEEIKGTLRRNIPDFDAYLENGQIEIIPYIQGYLKNGVLDFKKVLSGWVEKTSQSLAIGYDGLRFSGNSFWLETHWEDFVCYEEEVDSIIGKYRIIALCTYSLDKCNVTGIADIVSNHQFILAKKEGKWERIENSGRKRAEEAEIKLKETLENLEEKVKERTAELEEAYNSLLENERSLSEAQKIAHIGNWEWDFTNNKAHWSDEMYNIVGLSPQKFGLSYNKFLNYVHSDDRDYLNNAIKKALNGKPFGIDYRILTDEAERIVHAQGEVIFDEKRTPVRMRGTVQDITERKIAEEALERMEKIRIKEIHHRIKNNLQVISSLLSLEAERFSDAKMLEALRESQNRVASMALIHEELYEGDKIDTFDFAAYLRKLASDLFSSYNLGNDGISLKLDLEQAYLGMDTAIPLGIIVNELISNSLKHAFPAGSEGEIYISLWKTETFADKHETYCPGSYCMEKDDFQYILKVSDNGKGIPEEIDFENSDSLGLQLVNILVEQIDGCIKLKRNNGTEFTIRFRNVGE